MLDVLAHMLLHIDRVSRLNRQSGLWFLEPASLSFDRPRVTVPPIGPLRWRFLLPLCPNRGWLPAAPWAEADVIESTATDAVRMPLQTVRRTGHFPLILRRQLSAELKVPELHRDLGNPGKEVGTCREPVKLYFVLSAEGTRACCIA